MAENDLPTMAEIMRIVVRIEAAQIEILRELKADRVETAKTYMRQDVWLPERNLINAAISDTRTDVSNLDGKVDRFRDTYKKDRDGDDTKRRQMWMWIGGIAVTLLLGIGGLLISVLTLVR